MPICYGINKWALSIAGPYCTVLGQSQKIWEATSLTAILSWTVQIFDAFGKILLSFTKWILKATT